MATENVSALVAPTLAHQLHAQLNPLLCIESLLRGIVELAEGDVVNLAELAIREVGKVHDELDGLVTKAGRLVEVRHG